MVIIASGVASSWSAAYGSLATSCTVAGVFTGLAAGVACTIAESAKTLSLNAQLARSAATSAIASSVFGIFVSGAIGAGTQTLCAATIAAVAGALSGAGTAALGATAVAAEMLEGPAGLVVLGTDEGETSELTYDCWKAVVRDTSPEPSRGRLLRDVARSPMIKEVMLLPDSQTQMPQLFFHNVWDECFRVNFAILLSGELVAHAVRVE